jgi:uncharacterized protein (TIGR03083 family)
VVGHRQDGGVDVTEHIAELDRQGRALADAAAAAGLDAPVPTCPGWAVRDLLRHTGGVHGWAASLVRADPGADLDVPEDGLPQPHGDPVDWYRERHAELVAALRAAPADGPVPGFLPAPSPLAFWARRQAHECAVHRTDADVSAGASDPAAAHPPAFAVDGIDELLLGFLARPGRLRSADPYRLAVAPDDVAERWLVEAGPGGATARRWSGPADATLRGPAGLLYLFLWNRVPGVPVDGDAAVAARWRADARVTWE